MENAQRTSLCPEGLKVGVVSYLLKDRARDWLEEVGYTLGSATMVAMTWDDFVMRF